MLCAIVKANADLAGKQIVELNEAGLGESICNKCVVLAGIPGHAMTGLSYDKQSDSVTMWNPWGSTGNFKEVGTKMDHGTFTLAYDDFTQKITNVVVEDPSGHKEEHHEAAEVGKTINSMINVVNKVRREIP